MTAMVSTHLFTAYNKSASDKAWQEHKSTQPTHQIKDSQPSGMCTINIGNQIYCIYTVCIYVKPSLFEVSLWTHRLLIGLLDSLSPERGDSSSPKCRVLALKYKKRTKLNILNWQLPTQSCSHCFILPQTTQLPAAASDALTQHPVLSARHYYKPTQ